MYLAWFLAHGSANQHLDEQVDLMVQMVPPASKFPDSKIFRVQGQSVPCGKITRKAPWRR